MIMFFLVILDPFHHQWCLLKCILSAYENAGLKDIVGILAIDDQKWPNLLGESKNLHKAQAILEEIATSFGFLCVNYHLGRLSPDERIEFEAKSLMERSIWIQNTLFMEKLSYTDKTFSICVELYKFSILIV